MLKKLVTSILIISGFSVSAQAVTIKTDPQEACIIVSGNMPQTAQLKDISVNILYPDMEISDITSEGIDNVIAFSAQRPANEDGSFSITAKINGDSGIYTVFADYEGNEDKGGNKVAFIKKEDNESAIGRLIDSEDATEVEKVLKEDMFLLNFSNSLYESLDNAGVAEKYYGLMIENPFTKSDFDKAQKCFDRACMLEAISEKKAEDISESFELMDIAEDDKLLDYTKKDSELFSKKVAEVMSEREFVNIYEFKAALAEAIVLAVVYQPDGNGQIKNVISDFKEEIGISNPSESTRVYAALAGKDFDDYEELKDAYKKAASSNDKPATGGSGGGSKGGSGKDTSFITNTPVNVNKPEIAEPIEMSIFKDIGDVLWAKEAIEALYDEGIINGTSEGVFSPNDPVTREQFVTMIVRAFGLKEGAKISFNDVRESDWFYPYINAAYNNNVAKGFGDDFGVGYEITRQDMAVMVYNIIANRGIELSFKDETAEFSDGDMIASYAKDAVSALKKAGIINGIGNGCFEPSGRSTRAQAAVVIYSVLNAVKE